MFHLKIPKVYLVCDWIKEYLSFKLDCVENIPKPNKNDAPLLVNLEPALLVKSNSSLIESNMGRIKKATTPIIPA